MTIDLAAVAAILAGIRKDVPLGAPDEPFFDQGFDSLDVSALYLELEKRTGLTFSDEDMEAMDTAAKVVARVNAALEAAA